MNDKLPSADDVSISGGIVVKLLSLAVLFGVVWVIRPLFHPVIYPMLYSPAGVFALTIPTVIGILLFLAPPLQREDERQQDSSLMNKATLLGGILVLGVIAALVFGFAGGMVEDRTLAQETMNDVEMIDEMPQVNAENPRIVPRAVADIQTRGSVSYRTHRLGTSDIARMDDGRLAWSYPIQPDQFQNRLNGNQRGVLLSDMTAMEDREMAAYDEQSFKYGQGQVAYRSIGWRLHKQDFHVQYPDGAYEFVRDGEAYMAFPKMGHEWHLLPIPHTTPTWEGVALVHQDGTVDHLSPAEARESEILDGQRLYPLALAKEKSGALTYRNGITNALPLIGSYEGVVVPAELPTETGNEQPFVIDLEGEQMSYVMAMEPPGEDTRGLDEVWFYDADTGQPRAYGTGDNTLLGPERATAIVRSEDSRTQWAQGSDAESGFKIVEPVPVTVNDELWWHTKVTPVDNTDVSRNVFVNAHTGDAVEISTTSEIKQFLRGDQTAEDVGTAVGESGDGTSEVEPAPNESGVDFYVVVRDENGTVVDRIPFRSGYDVSIEGNQTDG